MNDTVTEVGYGVLRFSTILLKDFTNPLEHLTLNSWKIMMFCHEGGGVDCVYCAPNNTVELALHLLDIGISLKLIIIDARNPFCFEDEDEDSAKSCAKQEQN
ncbi:hypothetical protein FEM48_Zijuj09G0060800 [Ziziphus jujuba var. spinosa]|uniref:Uncharacterized protein n=1 Tax=Ziziphus jujuba var. spinosa TaxID=714518 RepID=A0A978URB2_ZIZJJ|nr:hypothetical protein FEM48_Zijuj09G0060800 [Ziziphus jujuba var. spinosa]